MKALTICQPYAQLIVLGKKRVENRAWPTSYRGPLYIHAGKSRAWFDDDAQLIRDFGYMPPFGAVVAIVDLIDCVRIIDITIGYYENKYPWLKAHEHTHGPWCWILSKVTPIGPWAWRGAQGLFEIDETELALVANREVGNNNAAQEPKP